MSVATQKAGGRGAARLASSYWLTPPDFISEICFIT